MGTLGEAGRRDHRDDALALDDGTRVRFRAVNPGDARALQRLHARCSGLSIELRFFGPLGGLPDKKAARLSRAEGAALVEDRWQGLGLDPIEVAGPPKEEPMQAISNGAPTPTAPVRTDRPRRAGSRGWPTSPPAARQTPSSARLR